MVDTRNRRIRAVIYCRISLATHDDKVKVRSQEKRCRKLAKRLGWDVGRVYCDNNKSAWRRDRLRPDWDAMLLAIEAGDVEAVIIYHGDRLIRQPWDLEKLLNLAEGRGIHLASPTGTRNLDNADDRYHLRLDVAHACKESDNISRRASDTHAERAAKGIPRRGGYRPFGYRRSGKVVVTEAAEYRDAVARLLAGESKSSIMRDWNTRGVLTTPGNAWSYGAFAKVMTSPRYAGQSVYKGEVVGKGKWKPLIDADSWEALQAKVGAIAERYGPAAPVSESKYLLSGIAVHQLCMTPMRVHHDTRPDQLGYRCADRECGNRVRRNMRSLDEFVIGFVLRRLSDPRLWARIEISRADNSASVKLKALRERKEQVEAEFAEEEGRSPALLGGILRKLDAQIEAARELVAQRQTVHVLDGCRDMTREQWDALPVTRCRALVRELVTVEVLPSRRGKVFDPESVVVRSVKVKV
jgi:site-specific DNA recombinase